MTVCLSRHGRETCFGVVQSCLGGSRSSPQPEMPNCNVRWSRKTMLLYLQVLALTTGDDILTTLTDRSVDLDDEELGAAVYDEKSRRWTVSVLPCCLLLLLAGWTRAAGLG